MCDDRQELSEKVILPDVEARSTLPTLHNETRNRVISSKWNCTEDSGVIPLRKETAKTPTAH